MDHNIYAGWVSPVGKKYGTDWLQLDPDAKKEDIDQWSIGGSNIGTRREQLRPRLRQRPYSPGPRGAHLRNGPNSYNMFVVESFMDEVAHALNRDPLEFDWPSSTGKAAPEAFPMPVTRRARPGLLHDRLWISPSWPNDNSGQCTVHHGWRALRLANRPGGRRKSWPGAKKPCPTPEWALLSPQPGAAKPDLSWHGSCRSENRSVQDQPVTIAMDPGTINRSTPRRKSRRSALYEPSWLSG